MVVIGVVLFLFVGFCFIGLILNGVWNISDGSSVVSVVYSSSVLNSIVGIWKCLCMIVVSIRVKIRVGVSVSEICRLLWKFLLNIIWCCS